MKEDEILVEKMNMKSKGFQDENIQLSVSSIPNITIESVKQNDLRACVSCGKKCGRHRKNMCK
ncbi:TPA: hypothetical protein QCY03_003486 [Bacillus tropicus]|nr:hypothetical protein [Bacillus tropicus]